MDCWTNFLENYLTITEGVYASLYIEDITESDFKHDRYEMFRISLT